MRSFVFNARREPFSAALPAHYVRELDARLAPEFERWSPPTALSRAAALAMEQTLLPLACQGRVLFSPAGSGPLSYARQVVAIHDTASHDLPCDDSGALGEWNRSMLPRLARSCLGVITVSEFSKRRISALFGVPSERIAVVPKGVSRPTPVGWSQAESLARSIRLPQRFLLFMGDSSPRTNLGGLLVAFAAASAGDLELVITGHSLKLLLAGSGIQILPPRARFIGPVDALVKEVLLSRATGIVCPSLYESTGDLPLEAMARACPVLCSDTASFAEACGLGCEYGGAPMYFNAASVEATARALRRFASLTFVERARMADAGLRRVVRFTWERCAALTTEVLIRFAAMPEPDHQGVALLRTAAA